MMKSGAFRFFTRGTPSWRSSS